MDKNAIIKRGRVGLLAEACGLIKELLRLLAAKNANQDIIETWCSVCARIGAGLHADVDRCPCMCHTARKFLAQHDESDAANSAHIA